LFGPRKDSEPFLVFETKMTRNWLRSHSFFLNTHRLELFVKGHFRVTIRKFVVAFVWLKYHLPFFGDET